MKSRLFVSWLWLVTMMPGTAGWADEATPKESAANGERQHGDERLRVLIETDAGGDPDDEQSLVRFLLYTNEWDVEGIICNRAQARVGENLNPERTGLAIARRLVDAYGECYPRLVQHDSRYPPPDVLRERTVAGYGDTDAGVQLIIATVDRDDPRPVWYCDWGTEPISASNLKRALDKVRAERDAAGYERFKSRLRIIAHNEPGAENLLGDHATRFAPPFPLWVDTFSPPLDGKRWYHRFSELTATAGGFDVERDVRTGHGPLGALYPTNTTHRQKEGDTPTFLYLVPTGMNDPNQPTWGSWAGRYGLNEDFPGRQYYWANQSDEWQGGTHRDRTLERWAVHLQNDFRARLNWCVTDHAGANHAPVVRIEGELRRSVQTGHKVTLDARESSDPDGHGLGFEWFHYVEPGSYRGPRLTIDGATSSLASFVAPRTETAVTVHLVLAVTDAGSPPLTRYQRVIVTIDPM